MSDPAWYANTVAVIAVGVSVAALMVSIASVLYGRRQTRAAEATLQLQANALDSQAQATTAALQLAERSVHAAEQSAADAQGLLHSRRAWVTLKAWRSTPAGSTVEPANATASIINSGESPAFDVQISHNFSIEHPQDFANMPALDYNEFFEPAHGGLGPQSVVEKVIEFRYADNNERQYVVEEMATLYWYGWIKYRDIFDKDRETKWCLEYNVNRQVFELCMLGNSAT